GGIGRWTRPALGRWRIGAPGARGHPARTIGGGRNLRDLAAPAALPLAAAPIVRAGWQRPLAAPTRGGAGGWPSAFPPNPDPAAGAVAHRGRSAGLPGAHSRQEAQGVPSPARAPRRTGGAAGGRAAARGGGSAGLAGSV